MTNHFPTQLAKCLTLNDRRVGYFELNPAGRKNLLIIHGWTPTGGKSWIKVGRLVSQHGFRVIIPDLPGFGRSEEPDAVWGIAGYASFVKSFLSALKIKKTLLLGHSFGGQIAAVFSAENPEKTAGLILAAPAIIRRPKASPASLRQRLISLVRPMTPLVPARLKEKIAPLLRSTDYQQSSPRLRLIMRRIIAQDQRAVCQRITGPVLIVWGDRDRLTPLADAFVIKRLIKNSLLEVFPEVKHGLQLQVPRQLATLIVGFASY